MELSKRNEHVVVDDKISQIESDIQTLKKQIQSSEDELLDLQELTDIRRSVSRAEPNLENELEDLRNELKAGVGIETMFTVSVPFYNRNEKWFLFFCSRLS